MGRAVQLYNWLTQARIKKGEPGKAPLLLLAVEFYLKKFLVNFGS